MKRQKAVVLAENQTAGRADEETNLVRLDRCPKVAGPWVEHSADNQLGDAGVAKGDGSQFRSGLAAGGVPGRERVFPFWRRESGGRVTETTKGDPETVST
jgi:hypothetical protein